MECAFLRASVLWALATNTELPTRARHAEAAKHVRATVAECARILAGDLQEPAAEVGGGVCGVAREELAG